jgi:hypothetical protein
VFAGQNAVVVEAGARRRVNGWLVYGLVLTGLVVAPLLISPVCMEPGRRKSIAAVETVLKLAGKRDFAGMARVASPQAVEFMLERDRQWGKVSSYAFEDALVQIGGSPAEVRYRVWRQRKNVRETFTCVQERVLRGSVTWPEAEAK